MNNKLKICVSLIVYTAVYRGKNLEKNHLFSFSFNSVFSFGLFFTKKIINFDNINNLTYINFLLVKKK